MIIVSKCNSIVISILILHVHLTTCSLSDIIKTDDDATIGHPVSPAQAFRFISTGVPHLLWSYVASSHFKGQRNISTACREALTAVSHSMSDGDILSFHFVDASGKTPSGFIRSSTSSFGDFDQCLSIDGTVRGVHVKGKYCACDLFPVRVSEFSDRRSDDPMTDGQLSFDRIHVFRRVPFINSLCVPHQCSQSDLRHILSTVVHPYALKVTGDISCDTGDTTSFVTKIKSLNSHQITALLFIASLITLVTVCTLIHLYAMYLSLMTGKTAALSDSIVSLSLFTATRNILWCKEQSWFMILYDTIKIPMILSGVFGHILLCLEIPLGFTVIDQHETIGRIFSSLAFQISMNEGFLAGMPAMSGLATALIAYPLIKRSKLNYAAAIVDRFLK